MSVKISEKQRLIVFINLMITGIATSMLRIQLKMGRCETTLQDGCP